MDEYSIYAQKPEEQTMLEEFQADMERRELSSRMSDIEDNGLYVRNLLNHINDKIVVPATGTIVPAITLAISSAGTIATFALGALYLVMKLR